MMVLEYHVQKLMRIAIRPNTRDLIFRKYIGFSDTVDVSDILKM